jgi:hypothetical protein
MGKKNWHANCEESYALENEEANPNESQISWLAKTLARQTLVANQACSKSSECSLNCHKDTSK